MRSRSPSGSGRPGSRRPPSWIRIPKGCGASGPRSPSSRWSRRCSASTAALPAARVALGRGTAHHRCPDHAGCGIRRFDARHRPSLGIRDARGARVSRGGLVELPRAPRRAVRLIGCRPQSARDHEPAPTSARTPASPSGVPGQCRSIASRPAWRIANRSTIATMIASSAYPSTGMKSGTRSIGMSR